MKKFIIGIIILVLVCIGISWASDKNDIKVYKANELINSQVRGFEYTYVRTDRVVKGISIYIKLIYQEEKKQTQLMEQILVKLNKGVENK